MPESLRLAKKAGLRWVYRVRYGEYLVWAAILFLVQVISFSGFFFKNEILVPSDLLFEIPPWSAHRPADYTAPSNILMYDPIMAFRPDFLRVQDSLRAGRWPLWNDMEMGGVPLLANCQSGVFYPLHLLLAVTGVDTAMSLFVIFKLWLAAFVAYVCARALGFGTWPSRWYSVAWGFGCFTQVWAYWPITDVIVWAPVLVVAAEWLVEGRLRKGFFALSLGGALLLFAGHPETAFAFCVYLTLYFGLRLALEWRKGRKPWMACLTFAAGWILAIAVYSAQLVPFLEYLQHSAPVADRVKMPLTLGALASFWVPRFFGTNAELTLWDKNVHNSNLTIQHYVGIAAWIGTALAIGYTVRKSSGMDENVRARVKCALAVVLLSMAMAMDIPQLEWAQNLPLFSHMRTIYHVYFTLVALPYLGLIGLDHWFRGKARFRDVTAMIFVLAMATAIVGLLWRYNEPLIVMSGNRDYVLREIVTSLVVALVTLLILLSHIVTKRTAALWLLLIVIGFCDARWQLRGLNPSIPRSQSFVATPLIAYMQAKPKPCRFDLLAAGIPPGTIGNFGIEEWDGYDGLYPDRPVYFRKTLSQQIWHRFVRAVGVDYFVKDPRRAELAPIQKLVDSGELTLETILDNLEVYRHTGMLPRARIVGRLETVRDANALFQRLLDDSFDPATTGVTDVDVSNFRPDNQTGEAGDAAIHLHAPDHVVIQCDSKTGGVLILADNWYPGWVATVNGAPSPVFPVYYCFRGVVVPKGSSTVEFRYRPRSLTAGIAISTIALIVSAGLALKLLTVRNR